MYCGFNYNAGTQEFALVTDAKMNLVSTIAADLQFYLDPPLVSAKRWHYDLYKDTAFKYQIFRIRTENLTPVIKEGFKSL